MVGSGSTEESSTQNDTRGELMGATRRALTMHGVADITTQKIADEWGKSQSLLHYYYDTKEDLLVAFIEHLRLKSQNAYEQQADASPLDRLQWFLSHEFHEGVTDDQRAFETALLELHATAPHNDRYRASLNAYEDDARTFLRETIQEGIESGIFRDVIVDHVVVVLLSAHDGGVLRTSTLGRSDDEVAVQAGLEAYIDSVLLADDIRLDEADGGGDHV